MSESSVSFAIQYRGRPDIASQLLGQYEIDAKQITTYEDYQLVYKIRHDLVHAIICDSKGYPFGEKSLLTMMNDQKVNFNDMTYFDQVKDQTPDIMEFNGSNCKIIEISVSQANKTEHGKASKYALLIYFLERNKINVDFEIIIINPRMVYLNREELITIHKMTDPSLDLMNTICENAYLLLDKVHESNKGKDWKAKFHNIIMSNEPWSCSTEDVINHYRHKDNKNKIFHSESDLLNLLKPKNYTKLSTTDEDFIDHITQMADEIKDPYSENESFDEWGFWNKFEKYKELSKGVPNQHYSDKKRPIFPFPYIDMTSIDAMERSLENDFLECNQMAAIMSMCTDSILTTIGKKMLDHAALIKKDEQLHTSFIVDIRLDKDSKRRIAIEGPRRKKYVRKGDVEAIEAQLKHRSYCLDYNVDVSEITNLTRWLSFFPQKEELNDPEEKANYLSNLENVGLKYVKVCQSINRELNINALRKERRHCFILKPTGIKGLFVLLHPGSSLRSGEIVNQVWFKIIINASYCSNYNPFPNMFKNLLTSGSVYHSEWMSTDAHRMDHYLRCYDKILMAYYSVLNTRFRTDISINDKKDTFVLNTTIYDSFIHDTSNTLGLIIAIYLEDKRNTSTTLQTLRYVLMTSISMYKYYNSVMDKMIMPIRSQLQLYIIKKGISFIDKMGKFNLASNFKVGKVHYDHLSKTFIDEKGGALLKLPRLISEDTTFPLVDFTENLCEVYFCMLFNKNQDDPTHSSMQILDKMLEGEFSKEQVKSKNRHLGYLPELSDVEFARLIITQPHTHQFSKRAIEIGSLLFTYNNHIDPDEDFKIAAMAHNVNKTIDEFATFKSSSVNERFQYDPTKIRQNSRRRCISGVMELLNQNCMTSSDVFNHSRDQVTSFQIFKKNQIGGPREILILPIEKRISINILETFSKNLCRLDKREMLTHGDIKIKALKNGLYEMRKHEKPRFLLYYNYDKSRWGPTFMPCQFLYMFSRFNAQFPKLFNLITHLIISHQNKRCLFPERLLKVWINDPANVRKHVFNDLLQKEKEMMLETGRIYFENESNMGQGILHFTSSLLHCGFLSFRDKIYHNLLLKHDFKDVDDHRDVVSSDDSLTIQSLEIHDIPKAKIKILLFLKAQYISELLFNMRTSKSKSSISALIGEFNSVFFSNLTFFPTLIKFAIAAVHPPNTDSFYRMVKESYISSRQIMENGGSLELYYLSHKMNKRYCEELYHTNEGNVNDLRKMGVHNYPYQLGVYPIFDPTLMLSLGPEFHNYVIYKKFNDLTEIEKIAFVASHKVIKGDIVETLASVEEGDTIMGGLLRIEAQVRPMRILIKLKKEAIMNRDEIESYIQNNILSLVCPATNYSETVFKTCLKLYQNSASEALKNNPSSIYFGRMSASVSANAFIIPNGNNDKSITFRECLQKILSEEIKSVRIHDIIQFLYPRYKEYEMYSDYKVITASQHIRDPMQTQSLHTYELHKIYSKLSFKISEVLSYFWFNKIPEKFSESKLKRDWSIIQVYYPLIKTSFEETRDQFGGTERDQLKSVITLLLKLYSLKDRTIKAITFGKSTDNLMETIQVLTNNNYYSGYVMDVKEKTEIKDLFKKEYELIYWWHNYSVLNALSGGRKWLRYFNDLDVNFDMFLQDPTISVNNKKRILILLLGCGRIYQVNKWTHLTDTILHHWEIPQTRDKFGQYSGDYILNLFKGDDVMNIHYYQSKDQLEIIMNRPLDPESMMRFFKEFCFVANSRLEEMWSKLPPGDWCVDKTSIFKFKNGKEIKFKQGLSIEFPIVGSVEIDVESEIIRLEDRKQGKIMSIPLGLFSTTIIQPIDSFTDFTIFNVKFSVLNRMQAFANHFNMMYQNPDEVLNYLDDLECEKPKVSRITMDRLNLREDWSIYDLDEKMRMMNSDLTVTDQTEEWYASLINLSPDELKLPEGMMDLDVKFLKDFFMELNPQGLFSTFQTKVEVVRTREIFERIKDFKYSMICLQVLSDMRISKSTLEHVARTYQNKFLTYSLVTLYDRTYVHKEMKSPEVILLKINDKFQNKFNLLDVNFRI